MRPRPTRAAAPPRWRGWRPTTRRPARAGRRGRREHRRRRARAAAARFRSRPRARRCGTRRRRFLPGAAAERASARSPPPPGGPGRGTLPGSAAPGTGTALRPPARRTRAAPRRTRAPRGDPARAGGHGLPLLRRRTERRREADRAPRIASHPRRWPATPAWWSPPPASGGTWRRGSRGSGAAGRPAHPRWECRSPRSRSTSRQRWN